MEISMFQGADQCSLPRGASPDQGVLSNLGWKSSARPCYYPGHRNPWGFRFILVLVTAQKHSSCFATALTNRNSRRQLPPPSQPRRFAFYKALLAISISFNPCNQSLWWVQRHRPLCPTSEKKLGGFLKEGTRKRLHRNGSLSPARLRIRLPPTSPS